MKTQLQKVQLIVSILLMQFIYVQLSAQVKLEKEVKITDEVMFFDGVNVGESGTVNNPNAYDYSFGNALTPHGDCIKTYKEFVFVTWYRGGKLDRHVMLSRYNMKTGVIKTIEFPHQHTGTNGKWWIGETHNTIAVGICPKDSTVHLLYDMHRNGNVAAFANDYLRYSYTVDGGATVPDEQFTINVFVNSAAGNYKHLNFEGIDNVTVTKLLTYPAFFTNDEGELFMKNRFGYSANGRLLFARYDGTKWYGYTDFNRSEAVNYGSAYNYGLYGDLKYLNGKIRVGFQRRSSNKTDKFEYQDGVYYAYSDDPTGLTQWKDHKGTGFTRPLGDAELIKVAEPGDFVQATLKDKVYIVGGFDYTITDNEDVHFVSIVKDNQYNVTKKLHTYKKNGAANFTTVEYNAGSELYAAGNDVYLIGLVGGRVNIVKTAGGTSNFQQVYQHTTGPTFDKGAVYVDNGKLYYYLKQAGGTGDKRTVYLQVFDLDIQGQEPYDPTRELSYKNVFPNQEIEKGSNLSIEANVGSAYKEVSLWYENTNLGTLTSAPYIWSNHAILTNMQSSEYTFKLIAKDQQNVAEERLVTISVVEPEPVFVADVDSLIKRLLFYCPLESAGTDLSGNSKHAKPGNAVTYETGVFGKAAKFTNSLGSHLTSADSVYKYSHPTAYTIAFWLKVSDYTTRADILQPALGRTLLYSNGTDFSYKAFHHKQTTTFYVPESDKNEWFHVAIVLDQRAGSIQHKYYVNGMQAGNNPKGYALETEKPQSISRLVFGAGSDASLARNLTGMIDELYMFNDTLSGKEITFLMDTENLMALKTQTSLKTANESQFRIYPNPAQDILFVVGDVAFANIYDTTGQLVLRNMDTKKGVNISTLSKGLYIIQLMNRRGILTSKSFVKQ